MTQPIAPIRPTAAVLAVLHCQNRFLLVRRANAPDAGLWGFPGGRIEPGETMFHAASRELLEETQVNAKGAKALTVFDSIHHDAAGALLFHYLIAVVLCALPEPMKDALPAPHPGDDALEAEWFDMTAIEQMGSRASSGLLPLARLACSDQGVL